MSASEEIEEEPDTFRERKSAASRKLKRLKQIATATPESTENAEPSSRVKKKGPSVGSKERGAPPAGQTVDEKPSPRDLQNVQDGSSEDEESLEVKPFLFSVTLLTLTHTLSHSINN